MGELTPNIGLSKPTIGGDSGGEDGTSAGGFPEQVNGNFDILDTEIQALKNEIVTFPANQVIVLDRSVGVVTVTGTVAEQNLYSRVITTDEILGRALRIELLGQVSGPSPGFYFDLAIKFGGQVLWKGRVPVDYTASLTLPLVISAKLIPLTNTDPRLFGIVMMGADGGSPSFGMGDMYGAVPASTAIASPDGSPTVDMTVSQTLSIDVTPSNTFIQISKIIASIIRE